MFVINADRGNHKIEIGYQGEDSGRVVRFDISTFIENVGEGDVHLVVQRPDEDKEHLIPLERHDIYADWIVTDAYVEKRGSGVAQLICYSENSKVKTETFELIIKKGLGTDPADDADQPLIDRLITYKEDAEAASLKAKDSAQKALTSENAAKEYLDEVKNIQNDVTEKSNQVTLDLSEIKELEKKASASAAAAGTSETNAKQSADNAAQSAAAADQTKQDTQKIKDDVSTISTNTVETMNHIYNATVIAKNAAESAQANAEDYAADAREAKNAANISANTAADFKIEASGFASDAKISADNAKKYKNDAQSAADRSNNAATKAENAVVNPPKMMDGTWWVWDFNQDQYVDTGTSVKGNVLYANFDIDTTSGELVMTYDPEMKNVQFGINNGDLEVNIG